ncbi:MAG: metal ABC transporter permease [Spirochaetales bacterium]|nr:metal ABC transporter permease [Spirochaetales bacterium]
MNELISVVIEPLKYPFMIRSLIGAIIVGIICSVVGTYIVLKGMAFLGDALAHAVLPGLAIAYFIGGTATLPLFWGSLIAGLFTATGIGLITKGGQLKEDTAIGIIFAGMFALGIAIISSVRNYSIDLTHFLFGDILGVSKQDIILAVIIGIVVLLLIVLFYKELLVTIFDPTLAKTLRIPLRLFQFMLLFMVTLVIVVSFQIVGVALMVAMLITPAASAYMLTNRLPSMMILSSVIGLVSSIVGLYFSYYLNIASGAAIVLTCTVVFIGVFIISPKKKVFIKL